MAQRRSQRSAVIKPLSHREDAFVDWPEIKRYFGGANYRIVSAFDVIQPINEYAEMLRLKWNRTEFGRLKKAIYFRASDR